jgi:hypothetical protein
MSCRSRTHTGPPLHPGAIDPEVTQDNLKTTICRSGYTATVRPPVSETGPAKRSQYQAYPIPDGTTSELDHSLSGALTENGRVLAFQSVIGKPLTRSV